MIVSSKPREGASTSPPQRPSRAAGTTTAGKARLALPVFVPASALIVLFVAFAIIAPDTASALFAGIQ